MKYIVAGGRDFKDRGLMCNVLDMLLAEDDTVITGMAKGADTLAWDIAMDWHYNLIEFPADWDKHGKSAGPIRNHQMALEGDALIAFWDGKSKGTKHMIEEAHKARLETHVYYYEAEK